MNGRISAQAQICGWVVEVDVSWLKDPDTTHYNSSCTVHVCDSWWCLVFSCRLAALRHWWCGFIKTLRAQEDYITTFILYLSRSIYAHPSRLIKRQTTVLSPFFCGVLSGLFIRLCPCRHTRLAFWAEIITFSHTTVYRGSVVSFLFIYLQMTEIIISHSLSNVLTVLKRLFLFASFFPCLLWFFKAFCQAHMTCAPSDQHDGES